MTAAALPTPLDVQRLLGSIDTMASEKPIAAHLVGLASADDTSARELAAILAADVALAGRVMKLANSAYFGMRGRVSSLQYAIAVVGFMTVRTMATVALTDLDDESRLPEDFWLTSTHLAQAAALLAPRFGERPPDALCLGMLAQLGCALLHHNDVDGYTALVAGAPDLPARRLAEERRYGIHALRLTAVALEHWGFPCRMVSALQHVDDLTAPDGALLRVAFEVAARLSGRPHDAVPVARLSGGLLSEDALDVVLDRVRAEAEKLRLAMLA